MKSITGHFLVTHFCPPIPGRVDYIHYVADLLSNSANTRSRSKQLTQEKNKKHTTRLLDIGTGASGIYGLLAAQQYGWECVGSDINTASLANLTNIIKQNPNVAPLFSVREQTDRGSIFKGIIRENEHYDVSVCNPPFHDSPEAATNSAERKIANLDRNRKRKRNKEDNPTPEKPKQHTKLWRTRCGALVQWRRASFFEEDG